ncbi:MAG: peptidoglycan-binding protein, partial [Pyrinomonadaceae bacterium]
MATLKLQSTGVAVRRLQEMLRVLGFDPNGVDGRFGPETKRAVKAFQKSAGLTVDGIAGPDTLSTLTDAVAGMATAGSAVAITPNLSTDAVAQMFPGTPRKNIEENLPFVLKAFADAGLGDKVMILMALATIRAETGNFTPLSEFKSKFNTAPGGPPFGLYDNRHDLGNLGPPDGANFRGRGYIQLTGRSNYQIHGVA